MHRRHQEWGICAQSVRVAAAFPFFFFLSKPVLAAQNASAPQELANAGIEGLMNLEVTTGSYVQRSVVFSVAGESPQKEIAGQHQ